MIYTDYRSAVSTIIGPILNFFGFHINEDGVIQKNDSNIGITLSGKHLYIPKDGYDYFASKDSSLLIPFNPFKIREHTLILSKFLCSTLSNQFRDEEDEQEYNSDGESIDIVSLVKRGPKNEDLLPATFDGVIYEIWCRNGEDILGKGIDYEGNDIKAILMAMIDTVSRFSNLINKNPDFNKIFKMIEKAETEKEKELEIARSQYSSNISQVDFSEDFMDNLDISIEENEEDIDEKDDENCEEDKVNVIKNQNYSQYNDESAFNDVDLF